MTAKVLVTFADGAELAAYENLRFHEAYDDPIATMSFRAVPPRSKIAEYNARLRKGEIVGLTVNGNPQAALMIETVDRTSGPGGYALNIQTCGTIKQLAESTVDVAAASKILSNDAPILDLVSAVVEPYGFTEVYATNDVAIIKAKTGKNPKATPTPADGVKNRVAKAEEGERVLAFLTRVLCRLALVLRQDPVNGALYITAPHYDGDPLTKVLQGTAEPGWDTFIGDVTDSDTNAGQWSFCETTVSTDDEQGATSANASSHRVLTTDINALRPPYRSVEQLAYKPCFHKDPQCNSAQMAANVSKLVLGHRAKSAYRVTGSVRSPAHPDGTPYAIDTLSRVKVPLLEVDDVLWLFERTFTADAGEGRSADLVWLPKGNFILGDPPA